MADSAVIKEFLVDLGFRTDEKALKNFTGSIEKASKAVVGLVTKIEGAALSIGAGISAFASSLDGLYFASQRTGAAATNLKAAEYAAKQLGVSAEEARGTIESMAAFLRNIPNSDGFLRNLGIQTHDANGQLRDTTDLLTDLGKRLASMPYHQARAYANVLGISDNMLRAIQSGQFADFMQDYRNLTAKSGLDKATKDANEFMKSLRAVGAMVESLGVQVQAALMQKAGPSLQKFSEWFEKNGPMIADRLAEILMIFLRLAEAVGPIIMALLDGFIRLDQATDGTSTKIIALLAILKLLGGGAVITAIGSLAASFVSLGLGIGKAVTSGGRLAVILGRLGLIGGAAAGGWAVGSWLNDKINKFVEEKTGQKGATLGTWLYDALHPEQQQQPIAPTPSTGEPLPRGIRNNNPGNLNFAGQRGATKESGPNGRFAVFGTAEEGLAALARQLRIYGSRGVDTVESIISRYAPASENNTKAYIDRVSKAMGVGAGDKLDLNNPEVMSKLMAQIIKHENGYNPYTQAQIASAAGGVSIAQNTTIHVTGAGDPAATGRAVASEQERVNAQMTRNMQTAVR